MWLFVSDLPGPGLPWAGFAWTVVFWQSAETDFCSEYLSHPVCYRCYGLIVAWRTVTVFVCVVGFVADCRNERRRGHS